MIKIVTRGTNSYLVNEEERYVKLVHKTKDIIVNCNEEDEFDEDFGISLAEAKVNGDKVLYEKLVSDRYPEPIVEEVEDIKEDKSNGDVVILIDETQKVIHSNIQKIFGFNIPSEQKADIQINIEIKDNKVKCRLIHTIGGFMDTVSFGEINIIDCPMGSLQDGIAVAELRARQDLYKKLEEKIIRR